MAASASVDKSSTAGRKARWSIRAMRKSDIPSCLDIWAQVDLTEARQTVSSALEVDPDGFFVAELEETGEVVGMCAGCMTRTDTAFMGFYAVQPVFQGQGLGRALWARTIGRLDASINVGLYGVPGMSEKYKKSGFIIEDTIRMLVFESCKEAQHPVDNECLKDIDELLGCRLVTIDWQTDENIFQKLLDYDQSVQKHSRESLLRTYLKGDDAPLTLAVVKDTAQLELAKTDHSGPGYIPERKSSCCARPNQEAINENEPLWTTKTSRRSSSILVSNGSPELLIPRATSPIDIPSPASSQAHHQTDNSIGSNEPSLEVLGYGCIRSDNRAGGMIGPLYADSSDLCEVILRNLIDRFHLKPGGFYSVMPLTSNKNACKILTRLGLREIDQCSRMFTKFVPTASFSKIFYVHSPNFSLF